MLNMISFFITYLSSCQPGPTDPGRSFPAAELEFQMPDFRAANFMRRRIFRISNLVKVWTFFG